jgi:short-subunit dehydrogenase
VRAQYLTEIELMFSSFSLPKKISQLKSEVIMKLRPLHEQVFFITGATSGIGLATVHMAVEQGTKVFMVARNEDELLNIHNELKGKGYDSAYAVVDVAEEMQLQHAAQNCVATFGRIDTFINNAGVSIYGRILDTSDEDAKRLFDTNFWGVVNGSKVAARIMKDFGGVIINVGSVLSDVAIPVQGMYSASKHAVKGFTDAFRREVMAEKWPLQVTLIKPSAIDTPYTEHAKSLIGTPTHQAPVYSAEVVAKTILHCAVKPTREIGVGSAAYIFPLINKLIPNLQDKFMSKSYMESGQSDKNKVQAREHGLEGNLHQTPTVEGKTEGDYSGHVMQSSAMTEMAERKSIFKSGAVAAGLAYLVLRRIRTL